MRCPTLSELPPPPIEKKGWPWTEESSNFSPPTFNQNEWPCISIITPSFNQGQFIEETIRAVLLQGYPNIEFIIADGGSTDNTIEIIKKYETFISNWVSEQDRGQSDALNKGFERATGQIFYWINSDDFPGKNSFFEIVEKFNQNPEVQVIFGDVYYIDETSEVLFLDKCKEFKTESLLVKNSIAQPALFFKSNLWKTFGPVTESLRFIMDYELWVRWATKGVNFKYFPVPLAYFRIHSSSKTTTWQKINQKERLELILALERSGELPYKVHKNIGKAFYQLCLETYWTQNFDLFWLSFFNYFRFTKRPPGLPLLARAFLTLLGRKVINFTWGVKHKFLPPRENKLQKII